MSKLTPAAITAQLATIEDIIPSTTEIYKETRSIESITANLNMIKMAVDAILAQEEEEVVTPDLEVSASGPEDVTIGVEVVNNNYVKMFVEGTNVTPGISDKETFGEIPNAIDVSINLPIVCGKLYNIKQTNAMLQHYNGKDSYVSEEDGEWVKDKSYFITDEDELDYAFLVGPGRNKITIVITGDEVITFDITTHIHFKQD